MIILLLQNVRSINVFSGQEFQVRVDDETLYQRRRRRRMRAGRMDVSNLT